MVSVPARTAIACTLVAALISVGVLAEVIEGEVDGIYNFSRYTGAPTFAGSLVGFGGQPEPAAIPWLAEQGFKTVISLRLDDEEGANIAENRAAAESAGVYYLHLPFDPENSSPVAVEAVLAAIGNKEIQPVFIHCNSATRAAAIWMIGRVTKDGLEIRTAEQEGSLIASKPEEANNFVEGYLATRGD